MILIKDICEIMEANAPLQTALSFDNVGLLVGNMNAEATGVVITVDVTRQALQKAIENNANMIIAHHPIIFNPLKRLNTGNYTDDIVMEAIRRRINLYACHTNADNAADGLNYNLIKVLGAKNINALCDDGTGRYGDIDCDIKELVKSVDTCVKGMLKINYAPSRQRVRRIALVTGSGGRDEDIAKRVFDIGADCYLTAEVAHNIRLEFIDKGLNLIEFGHYESERIFIDIIMRWLEDVKINKIIEYNCDFFN